MSTGFEFNGLNEASYWNGQYGSLPWLQSLEDATELGANTIAITSTSYLATKTSSSIYSTNQTESLANVAKALDDASAQGLSTVLKPHIDLADGAWRGRLAPADVSAFFTNYKAYILDYAKLAADHGVDLLVIGTELDQLAGPQYHDQWADIVSAVREVYSGPITYASNSDGNVAIWDLVDYIGINPYVPLAPGSAGTVADYVAAWNQVPQDPGLAAAFHNLSPVDYYKQLSETYDKPLLMTELGYRSLDGTAAAPMDYVRSGAVDEGEQAALYQAFFQVFSGQSSWMKGAMIWGWATDRATQETKSNWATGYSIEGKQAEDVVHDWFSGDQPASADHPTEIVVRMAANVAGGPAMATVVVDRKIVGTFAVDNTTQNGFKDYTVLASIEPGSGQHTVEVYFTNPAGGRGLHVDYVSIGGERFQAETSGPASGYVTSYSKGTVIKVAVDAPPDTPDTANHAPAAAAQVQITVNEDTASTPIQIGASDTDGDTLSYFVKPGLGPAKGAVTLQDGAFVYTPKPNANGSDTFTIQVSDGKGGVLEQVVSVTVTPVNDAPVTAAAAETASGHAGRDIAGRLLAGSDRDLGDTLTFAAGTIAAVGGSVVIDPGTGAFVFTPTPGFSGAGSFSYLVSDGHAESASKSVSVTVTPNHAAAGQVLLSDASPSSGQAVQVLPPQISDDDGVTGQLSYAWQSSVDGVTWIDIAGATGASFTPGTSEVGKLLQAKVSFLDGGGTLESVTSAATSITGAYKIGTSGSDTMNGTAGADILDGRAGQDRLSGGAGDDIYLVDNVRDAVTENADQGIDTIRSSVTYTAAANVENLELTGSAAVNATGNALDNRLTGNQAANVLSGGTGADTLIGGGGNDKATGGAGNDIFIEGAGSGNDAYDGGLDYDTIDFSALTSGVKINLSTGVATGAQTGTDKLTAIENAIGGSGDDILTAGTARNVLVGGDGHDTFVFVSTAAAGTGGSRDVIKDFHDGIDKIDLSGIDANTGVKGDQAFTALIGANPFGDEQQIRIYQTTIDGLVHTIVEGNVNASNGADFQIDLLGAHALTPSDFIL